MSRSPIPDVTSKELQAICVIAEEGSFMAAALTLKVSQPALTRTVQRVEQALGIKLFSRTTRRLEITSAGQEFIALANRVLNDLRISFDSMREISDEQRGQVIVSAVMSVAYNELPAIVAGYRRSRPRIEMQIREGVHGTVVEDVRSGVADLGLTYVDDIPDDFSSIALDREAFHVVMPRGHELSAKPRMALAEVAQYAMVSLPNDSQTRRILDGLAVAAGLALQHVVTVSQFATLMQCVHAGVGLSIVPSGAVAGALRSGLICRPLAQPSVSRTMGVVVLRDRALTPSAQGFLNHLQDQWPANAKGRRKRRR